MGDVMPSAARRLARFVIGLRLDDVPSPVVTKAALLALDTLGCALASTRYDFGRAAVQTAERRGGPQESTLVGSKVRVAAANAVLANATLAHGLDCDDTREDAIVHTGSVAVPTALAVGEALGASGRATLAAMVAGVEVMCRVGLAVPGKLHARHYHPTALAGTFAAAAVAANLHGLTEGELVHAFGICGSQAGGIIEYLADGSWTKRLHPGWAGGPSRGAAGGEAGAAERLRREVQPAVSPGRHPRQGAGRPRRVRGRGRARHRRARRRRPSALRARSDHRLSAAVRRACRDPAPRRAGPRGAPGSPAGGRYVSDDGRRAGGEVPWQRRPRHVGRGGVAGAPPRERARHSRKPPRPRGGSHTVRGQGMRKRSTLLGVLAATGGLTAAAASSGHDGRGEAARKEGQAAWCTSPALSGSAKVS